MDLIWLLGVLIGALAPLFAERIAGAVRAAHLEEIEADVEDGMDSGIVNRRLPFNWLWRLRWQLRLHRLKRWTIRKLTGYTPPELPPPPL